jgi:hypothetical protein
MSKKSKQQQLQLLKNRHENLLQIIVSMRPSFSKTIQQSFITSHPLQLLNGRNEDRYKASIKNTIRDYFDSGEISQFPTQTDETLIDKIYRKFRDKEYSEYLKSGIPRQKVLRFLDPVILNEVLRRGKEGRQIAKNIQTVTLEDQKMAIQEMIDYLKIKLNLKTINVETANVKKFSTSPFFLSEIYGIPIPLPHEEIETVKQLLEEDDFKYLFEKYRSFSPQGEGLKLEPIRVHQSEGNDKDQFMLLLGKIFQPYLLNSKNGLILLTDEKKDMVNDVYFNRIVTPKLMRGRGFKHRFISQQPMMEGLLSDAASQNNFVRVGQLSPYLEPLTLYEQYKKLSGDLHWSYLRFMVMNESSGIVLYSLAKIAFQQKDAEALYKIWRRFYFVHYQPCNSIGKNMLVLFDADVLCKIIKETNEEEEANSGLFILAQCAIQFNLLLSAIKIIRQLDYAHERKHLLQNITTKLYKENKVYQFLSENKDELTVDEISKIRHVELYVKNWKIFFKLIFLVLYCLIVVIVVYVVVYVAIFMKNRYGKMVMFTFLLFTILALYILLGTLWSALYILGLLGIYCTYIYLLDFKFL